MKQRLPALLGVLCTMACLSISAEAEETTLTLATVDSSRQSARTMQAFASIVSNNLEGVHINAFTGGIETLDMMSVGRGIIDMSMTTPVAFDLMSREQAMFQQETVVSELSAVVQLVMWFPQGRYYFAVRKDSEIETLDDLKGASVFLGPDELSISYHHAKRWIAASTGLTAKEDYQAVATDWQAGAQAFLNNEIDVFVSACLDPCMLFADLSTAIGLRFLAPVTKESAAIETFLRAGRSRAEVPAGMLAGAKIDGAKASFQTSAGIAVYADLDEQMVYDMTKAYWENLEQIPADQIWARSFDPRYASTKRGSIKLHPGAARYYREIGVLD